MDVDTLREALPPHWRPWLAWLLGLMLLAAIVEGLWLERRRGHYDWRALAASLADAALRRAANFLGLSIAVPVGVWVYEHRIHSLPMDQASHWIVLFLGQEFCYYWFHRVSHRVRWFWATHAVHHSPNELTLATSVRLGITGGITGTALFFMPLVWLGFPPQAVLGMVAANLLYQFWVHTDWIPRLGPLEWVLNTPAHHRLHHARNPEYLDCNYGGVLIIFDRLFGSLRVERPGHPPAYGLTRPVYSYNPLYVALHEWANLLRDMRQASSLRGAWRVLAGPP